MSNLYEILEVSEKASNEVIEKAYKVLAKKHHPDLQVPEKRKTSEEKMKQINDAYDTLINTDKRSEYDEDLARERQRKKIEEENRIRNSQNINRGTNQNIVRKVYSNQNVNNSYKTPNNADENKIRRQYVKAYNKEVRRIKIEMKLKKIRDLSITIGIMILIAIILWVLPPTRKMLIEFYENNFVVKFFVDLIVNLIKSFSFK